MAFEFQQYHNPYAGTIAELMGVPAAVRAQADQAKAAAWGSAARDIGSDVSGAVQTAMDPQRQLAEQQIKDGTANKNFQTTTNQIISGLMKQNDNGTRTVDRVKAQQLLSQANVPLALQTSTFKQLDDMDASATKYQQTRIDHAADIAHSAIGMIDQHVDPRMAASIAIAYAKANKMATDDELAPLIQAVSTAQDPATIKPMLMAVRGLSEKYKDLSKPVVIPNNGKLVNPEAPPGTPPIATNTDPLKGNYTINGQRFSADGTAIGDAVPPQPRPEGKQSKSVLLDGKPAEVVFDPGAGKYFDASGADVSARVKPIPPASTIVNPGALSDVKETVAGMKDGSLPPLMPGRATKEYLATMAEAHRQGYDLQAAVTDWNATQKHIATLNGSQQTRLNQSIGALPDLLDSVDALASKWKGGQFPVLNKANLALAKNGVYGEDVATVARQLDSQIADVTGDLGAVYMGGNSPTDHALDLASKSLSGDWSEKVLHDMVSLARKNVVIRQNSIKNTGVAGASPDNPYAPKQPAATTAPSAPAGWKYVAKPGGGWTAIPDKQ